MAEFLFSVYTKHSRQLKIVAAKEMVLETTMAVTATTTKYAPIAAKPDIPESNVLKKMKDAITVEETTMSRVIVFSNIPT